MTKKLLLSTYILTLFFSCNMKTSKEIDADKVNQEIKERKIKRLLPADISNAAFSIGQKIEHFYFSEDKTYACGDTLSVLPDSLSQFVKYQELLCDKPSDEQLLKVWQAYQYQLGQDSNVSLNENLQGTIDETGYWYTVPFKKDSTLILFNCLIDKKQVVLSM